MKIAFAGTKGAGKSSADDYFVFCIRLDRNDSEQEGYEWDYEAAFASQDLIESIKSIPNCKWDYVDGSLDLFKELTHVDPQTDIDEVEEEEKVDEFHYREIIDRLDLEIQMLHNSFENYSNDNKNEISSLIIGAKTLLQEAKEIASKKTQEDFDNYHQILDRLDAHTNIMSSILEKHAVYRCDKQIADLIDRAQYMIAEAYQGVGNFK